MFHSFIIQQQLAVTSGLINSGTFCRPAHQMTLRTKDILGVRLEIRKPLTHNGPAHHLRNQHDHDRKVATDLIEQVLYM